MTDFANHGVRLAGVGSAVPSRVLTNQDFERMLDTSDEWITKRTGIRERRICAEGENGLTLTRDAINNALEMAGMRPADLDLIIIGTCTQDMNVPSLACRVSDALGAAPAGAFDVVAACSGYLYALNLGETLVRSGRYRTVATVGCDIMSHITDYQDRSLSILFGDAAGAAILTRDDDPARGCIYQTMNADGTNWDHLYQPHDEKDIPEWDRDNPIRLHYLRMQGREVYKFAVNKFREVIEDALDKTGLQVDDVAQFICHQSNARIIESAKEKIGLPDDKVLINIDRYGNSSAGSVGLCVDQLWRCGKIREGDTIVLVAFGGGLTWASSVWKV